MSKLSTLPTPVADIAPAAEAPTVPSKRVTALRAGVLNALGKPPDLLRVAVIPLWGDQFRVNVYTRGDSAAASIPHSYFVTADDDGKVLRASPPIEKQY